MLKAIFPYKDDFPDHLASYIDQIVEVIRNNRHHDQRRQLFINFLRQGFDVDPVEVELEKKIKVAKVKGRIDAFFKATIFEFKTDLERERPAALVELKKYFEAQPNPTDYVALLTDGLSFEVYQYESFQPFKIGIFKLTKQDPLTSFRNLDQFIFSSKAIQPESADIVQRFGLYSAVFNSCRSLLEDIYETVKKESTVKVKLKEWNMLLSRVYGTELGDIALFIKHTYLTMLSRLLVAKTLFPREKRRTVDYRGLLTGGYFIKKNLPNLVEPDFFSWALDTPVESHFIGFLSKLESYLDIYDLSEIGEDILKELYQELVDPESRHALGEYYTPDWLAALTLDAIKYRKGRLLDPACGSGSFLFNAIQCKRKSGLKGNKLIDEVKDSIIGIDVHPLAVMMSKANMLLALNEEIKKYKKDIYLKIYLADTLLVAEDIKKKCISINVTTKEIFYIPLSTIERHIDLDKLIDTISSYAHKVARGIKEEEALKGLNKTVFTELSSEELFYWKHNFKLMVKLIKGKRNSIWPFILKNTYRPAFLRLEKVDYIVGNPPWLAYRYIKDDAYKARVKELTFKLSLLEKRDVKLFTHMDTSTIFYEYCSEEFLKQGGTIAFVMPKTTILPAKQHILFQQNGFTEIYDFSGVQPLFNVRAVVLVRRGMSALTSNIPLVNYTGLLPQKNMRLKDAKRYLIQEQDIHSFITETYDSPYFNRVFQGATIVPRCFWFVQLSEDAYQNYKVPHLETTEEAIKESKPRWKGLHFQGRIESDFIFETVLAKGLLPFVVIRREPVVLPIKKLKDGILVVDADQLISDGKEYAAEWINNVQKKWDELSSEKRTILERLNYNNTLINQNINADLILIYNASGTNLTAALINPMREFNGLRINGFIADAKTYYYYPKSLKEGAYLSAMLNSGIVNERIKAYQPQGLYGERDIHRRPFEACPIPLFNANDPEHIRLSELGKECRTILEKTAPKMVGTLGRRRLEAKRIIAPQIGEINKIVSSILKKEGQDDKGIKLRKKRNTSQNLFDV